MKLSYLADLINVKRNGKQISDFEYRRHFYGPFDKAVYSYVESLSEQKLISAESDYGSTGEEFSVYFINPEKETAVTFEKINETERNVMDELLNSVKGYGAKMLTEIAYKTKPLKSLKATIGGSEGLGKMLNLEG